MNQFQVQAPVAPNQFNKPPGQGDWFSQTGFATALGAAAMTAVAGNEQAATQIVANAFGGAFDAERQKSLSWFQTQTFLFRQYFNVTHSYVRWKLLYVILPFMQSSGQMISRTVSRDVPTSGDNDEQTAQGGGGLGLRLFPGRKPDMYLPLMGFITFVLVHCLSRWEEFHPDDLYNIGSLGILLGVVEVLAVKGASYVMNIPNWTFTDIVAICGYKFINLSVSIMLLMVLAPMFGRSAWIAAYLFGAAMAGLTVQKSLVAVGSYNANTQHYMGNSTGAMERLVALAAGGAQFLWTWILMPSVKLAVVAQTMASSGGGVRVQPMAAT